MMRTIVIPMLFGCATCTAQILTNRGASITLRSAAQLTVKGDVLLGTAGTIANDGTIDLNGDWTNNSGGDCFGSSEGVVIMEGAWRSIRGSSPTQFNHLWLVGGPVKLEQDQLVGGGASTSRTGVLALNDAILELNGHRLTITDPAPSAITRNVGMLISETDPIMGHGRLEWALGDSPPASYTVPFGNSATGHYVPLVMDITSAGVGANGRISFATYPTDPMAAPNNRPLPNGLTTLIDIAGVENAPHVVDRFWVIDEQGYLVAPMAAYTFTYRDSEWSGGTNLIVESGLQAQRFNGMQWSFPPGGTVDPALNQVSTGITGGNGIIWALTMTLTPLPVELVLFEATPDRDVVRCHWITETERETDHFVVERSTDGIVFMDIGSLPAAGYSQTARSYHLVDPHPEMGWSYYRLRSVDTDGSATWSELASVWMADDANEGLRLWPNPTTGVVHVSGIVDGDRIRVLDADGKRVYDAGPAGSASSPIDLTGLAGGVYTLQAVGGDAVRTIRFVKQGP